MKVPAIFTGLFIAAGAAFVSAPAAIAAPAAGSVTLGQADASPTVQVQYRDRYGYRWHRGYRSYGYGSYATDFRRRGCVSGDEATTSAYPSWMVCHRR
jgi:hypothetical protein